VDEEAIACAGLQSQKNNNILKIKFVLTLYRSYLKPYCTGRKTAFFQCPFKCIGQQERFTAFRPARDV
jgi:hypothetical protein